MEAPEKIYLSEYTDTSEYCFYVGKFSTRDTDIEYTRTDAFIERAVEWLDNVIDNGCWIANDVGKREKDVIIEDMKNYLKK